MRIGITGTHGSGKTTLANLLSLYTRIPLIKERARTVARRWGLTPATIPSKNKFEFQFEVLFEQIMQEKEHKSGFISDRTVYDNLAYYRAIWWHQNSSDYYDWWNQDRQDVLTHWETFAKSRYECMVKENGNYDLIFVLKPEWDLVDDGERHTDEAFQKTIEHEIDTIIEQYAKSHTEVILLQGSSTHKRLDAALNIIEARTE